MTETAKVSNGSNFAQLSCKIDRRLPSSQKKQFLQKQGKTNLSTSTGNYSEQYLRVGYVEKQKEKNTVSQMKDLKLRVEFSAYFTYVVPAHS